MTSFLERSFLMALGAAVMTRDAAQAVADELTRKGQDTSAEGRKLVDESVEQARESTRTIRDRIDENLERTLRDMGLVMQEQLEEIQLKLAQLEHRIGLLESGAVMPAAPPHAPGSGPVEDLAEASEEYHEFRERQAEQEALNPHLDVP